MIFKCASSFFVFSFQVTNLYQVDLVISKEFHDHLFPLLICSESGNSLYYVSTAAAKRCKHFALVGSGQAIT